MLTKPAQLESDLFRAIDGYIIAKIEDALGNDDPGISVEVARKELQKQIRILCNEACSYKPEPVYGPVKVPYPVVGTLPIDWMDNFEMKELFAGPLVASSTPVGN